MTAVLTGASRGIGRAAALELGARGVPLALLGRPSAALDEVTNLLRSRGCPTEVFPCDLRRAEQIASATQGVLQRFGAPRVVVNDAGIIHRNPIHRMTDDEWDEQLEVNLRAPFLITRAFLPAMLAAKTGRILQISSISATLGTRSGAAYGASKWGLVGLMKSLAEEITGTGLMTMALLPGSVDTDMLKGSGLEPRMSAAEVAKTIAYYALEAPLAHNGGVVEMFGI